MPTPSDGTAKPERTRAAMEAQAQAALDEQARQVLECRRSCAESHQRSIPHSSGSEYGETAQGDVIYTERSEGESESGDGSAESSSESELD